MPLKLAQGVKSRNGPVNGKEISIKPIVLSGGQVKLNVRSINEPPEILSEDKDGNISKFGRDSAVQPKTFRPKRDGIGLVGH
jgi:hypothetical protein